MQSGSVQVRVGAAAGSGTARRCSRRTGEPVQRRYSWVYVRHGGDSIMRIYLHQA